MAWQFERNISLQLLTAAAWFIIGRFSPKRTRASGMYIRNYSGDIFFIADTALSPPLDRKSVRDVFYDTTEKPLSPSSFLPVTAHSSSLRFMNIHPPKKLAQRISLCFPYKLINLKL